MRYKSSEFPLFCIYWFRCRHEVIFTLKHLEKERSTLYSSRIFHQSGECGARVKIVNANVLLYILGSGMIQRMHGGLAIFVGTSGP